MTRPLAVLFHRLGPYHHARLQAARRLGPVIAVEYSSIDHTYQWATVAPSGAFRIETLFGETAVGHESVAQVRSRVSAILADINPAVVAIPGWSSRPSLIALEWCLRHGIPTVVMSESQESDADRNWAIEGAKGRIVRLFSAGLVGGRAHQEYLVKLGMPTDRIRLGYDVVDNAHFTLGADAVRKNAAARRRELELPERFFLASNRFVPKKNLERLLEAYARYRRRAGAASWKLVLLGDGELRPRLIQLRNQLGLGEDVLLPGFKQYDALPDYYGLAQAFVHASTVEQWGLVVNEAMAAGLPVLVSERCGCVLELVRDGVNGHVFDPERPEDLAKWLAWLSGGEADLGAMARESSEIIAHWTPERFACGLHAAASAAAQVGTPRASILDHLLLRGLVLR